MLNNEQAIQGDPLEDAPSRASSTRQPGSGPGFVLAAVLLVFALAKVWSISQSSPAVDFYVFWAVPQALTDMPDVGNVYSDEGRKKISHAFARRAAQTDSKHFRQAAGHWLEGVGTKSTPFFFWVFHALALGDYDRDTTIYQTLSLAAMVFAVLIACRMLGYSWVASMLALALFIGAFSPVDSDVVVGNVNRLLLAVVVFYLWVRKKEAWRGRDFAGGLVLGFVSMFKPVLVFAVGGIILSRLMRRDFRCFFWESLGIASAALVALLVSIRSFGSLNSWTHWLRQLSETLATPPALKYGNCAPGMVIKELLGIEMFVQLGITLVAVATVGLYFAIRNGSRQRRQSDAWFLDCTIVSVGLLIYLLCSKLAWLHYYILAIPGVLLVLRSCAIRGTRGGGLVTAQAVLTMVTVILLAQPGLIVQSFGIKYPYAPAIMIGTATVILFGLTVWVLIAFGLRSKDEQGCLADSKAQK